jgi:hypothetical protein
MFRRKLSVLALSGLALSLSGCSVNLAGTTSTAIQSVINTLFANVTASVVNGIIPLPG